MNQNKTYQINLDTFKENTKTCTAPSDKEAIIANCPDTMRIAMSLKYYHVLCKDNEQPSGKITFTDFCIESYPDCLDDYIHLITVHGDSSNQIKQELQQQYDFEECKLNQCKCTRRHYRNLNDENEEKVPIENQFYTDIFDTIHFYVFHMQQMGLRGLISTPFQRIVSDKDDLSDTVSSNCVDTQFNAIQTKIKAIQKENNLPAIDKSKFIIKAVDKSTLNTTNTAKEDNTWTDNLFSYVKKNCIDYVNFSHQLDTFLNEEEYDTDSIQSDNDIYYDSDSKMCTCNILNRVNNVQFIHTIKDFIMYHNIHSKKFSTGIAFFYWNWFKDVEYQTAFQQKWDVSNYMTFGVEDGKTYNLFVDAYYDSLKTEALKSGLMSISEFNKHVVNKANHYINTKKCKKLKNVHPRTVDTDPLHCGITFEAQVKEQHLQSLIIYCNFTDLCTELSSTFRQTYWEEPIECIKMRNSKYHHISKYLRELVDYYGLRGSGMTPNGRENGPFYTGLSIVLNMPCFAIRLHGPTSTSKQIQVAINFAKRNGLILQMNNKYFWSSTFFDCSWISTFPEEDERLFMGGRRRLELESIRVHDHKTNQWQNYENFIKAFCLFDAMLNSELPIKAKITSKDVQAIDLSIKHYLTIKSNDFAKYLQDTFYLFCHKKTNISLGLHNMEKTKNKEFVSLIMDGSIIQQDSAGNNANNIFKSQLFHLFPNWTEIIIHTVAGKYCYALNIDNLLSIFAAYLNSNSSKKSTRKIIVKDCGQKWLANSFDCVLKDYLEQFQIELKTNMKGIMYPYWKDDWIVITYPHIKEDKNMVVNDWRVI